MTEVVIYTDGACSGNPGRGGWGAVLRWNGTEKELHGGEPLTTNNRMELMAAIQALEALNRPSQVILHTDSKYLLDGITKWIAGWQRNGWLTSAKKPVKNDDLWRRLLAALDGHEVSWQWVRGHAGEEGNERADALARLGAEEAAALAAAGGAGAIGRGEDDDQGQVLGDVGEPVGLAGRDEDHAARAHLGGARVRLQRGPAGADHVDLVLGVRGLVVQAAGRDAVRTQAQVLAAQVDDPVVGLGAVGRGVGAGFRDDPHVSSVSDR